MSSFGKKSGFGMRKPGFGASGHGECTCSLDLRVLICVMTLSLLGSIHVHTFETIKDCKSEHGDLLQFTFSHFLLPGHAMAQVCSTQTVWWMGHTSISSCFYFRFSTYPISRHSGNAGLSQVWVCVWGGPETSCQVFPYLLNEWVFTSNCLSQVLQQPWW
jgi:hypothetical protein